MNRLKCITNQIEIMELAITSRNFKAYKNDQNSEPIKMGGILNSNYQDVVNSTLRYAPKHSLYGIRQYVKIRQNQMVTSVDAILKLSIFTAAILLIFS